MLIQRNVFEKFKKGGVPMHRDGHPPIFSIQLTGDYRISSRASPGISTSSIVGATISNRCRAQQQTTFAVETINR